MIMLGRILFILLFICGLAFAAGDIPPEKGDVTKNIHVILDYSGSMNAEDLQNQLNQFFRVAIHVMDEYNLSVSVFGGTFHRMVPGPDCDLSEDYKGWMSMPSANNIKAIEKWFGEIDLVVSKDYTVGIPPIRIALLEDIEDLTVIVISDCVFDDKAEMYDAFDDLEKVRKSNPAKLGFIDVDDCPHDIEEMEYPGQMFALCKAHGWWLMNTLPCSHEEQKNE